MNKFLLIKYKSLLMLYCKRRGAMNILEAIMITVGVISIIFCSIGTIITLLTTGDDNDQA